MIAGIMLAAGRSQRMGQAKLLLPWQGNLLIRHVVQQALHSNLDELVVVMGHRAEHIRAAIADLPVRLILNDAFLDGQSTSVRAGIAALPDEAAAVIILLADQPLLQPVTVNLLITHFLDTHASIVVPRYHGQRGNPVLFARSLFPELQALTGDQGARHIFAQYAKIVQWVDVEDEGILLDVDTPDAYQQLADRSQL